MDGWVISAASDWIFVIVLLLSLPVFIIGWNIVLKIKWRQLVVNTMKKMWYALRRLWHSVFGSKIIVEPKKVKYMKKKSHKKQRPAPLYTSARAMERNAQRRSEMSSYSAQSTSVSGNASGMGAGVMAPLSESMQSRNDDFPSFLDDADFANMSLDDIQLPTREPLNEDIPDILIKKGYQVIANPQIGAMAVDFVIVEAHKIYVLLSDNDVGDWLADEERFNGEDPLWFSESSHRVSPIFTMNTEIKPFSNRLKTAGIAHEVVPVLVVKEGTIINAEDMQKTWDDMGIIVCRTHLGGPDELPSVAQAMPDVSEAADISDIEKIRNAF
ncbi:MAG: hypothetical protein IKV03_03990 [Alphaproteobacteria bacterium]|nr:hypothetical protein [Alphaproteobacteria bacterium]